jgi:hypothetical protein
MGPLPQSLKGVEIIDGSNRRITLCLRRLSSNQPCTAKTGSYLRLVEEFSRCVMIELMTMKYGYS